VADSLDARRRRGLSSARRGRATANHPLIASGSVTDPVRLAVFVSGGGTNLQALLNHFNAASSPAARVDLVVASRAGIGALARAEEAGVQSAVIDPSVLGGKAAAGALLELLEEHSVGLIALAGYLRLVP